MRRWLIVIAMLVAGEAAARVIREPPLVRKCPIGKTWNEVATCLAKAGTVKVLRQQADMRLVQLSQPQAHRLEAGLLLYVLRRGRWRVGGHWQAYDTEYQLLGFERLTIGKDKGFRIDIGQVTPMQLVVDDISPVKAQLRMRRSLYCSGKRYECADVPTTCEVLVRGNARFVFRGAITIKDNLITVTGDTSRAGRHCALPQSHSLGWAAEEYDDGF